jgi:hypothetical protein
MHKIPKTHNVVDSLIYINTIKININSISMYYIS